MTTVHETLVAVRAAFTGIGKKTLPAFVSGEEDLLNIYDEAIAEAANTVARLQPDLIKIDMELLRDIHLSPAKQAIVAGIAGIARSLDIKLLAEGVETEQEFSVLRGSDISLFQGYLLPSRR